ncbi:hypothetical protein P9228_05920 [Mesorhizobium sp. WSM4898]|uniref:hypothetical protein n=1 Tax=Mesorhizobium sp. WSM4898 TaxID=3038544 RepID=UPI00241528C8|nr:hypothetical protein [Mesorhizobium sp. WSM4898]MDG4905984.1 hypothetical protein [Mesorhizobium sp. WSM4898]
MTALQLPCGRITTVDDADVHLLEGLNWYAEERGRTFYVRGRQPGARKGGVYLHNLIMGGRADHRDADGLNNSRSNLRPCTQAQNGLNRRPKNGKRFKGVFFDKRRGTFYAQVALAGKVYSSPGFNVEEDAARWHDAKALSLHGEFAHLNFPAPHPQFARQESML